MHLLITCVKLILKVNNTYSLLLTMLVNSLIILLTIQLITTSIKANNKLQHFSDICDIITQINNQEKLQINLLINLEIEQINNTDFLKATKLQKPTKLIINQQQLNLKPLYKTFSDQSLTIAWSSEKTLDKTLQIIDRLLWTIHFKDILLVYQGVEENLENIFHKCWKYGFISVLVWSQNHLYTYHPYPQIKVVQLNNIKEFTHKRYLDNFQGFKMILPIMEFPPVCFMYKNSKGQLFYVGYFYKWIELFLKQHNATIQHHKIDMWSINATLPTIKKSLNQMNFSFILTEFPKSEDFASSIALMIIKTYILVPSGQEILQSKYIIKTFTPIIWLFILLYGLLFLGLILLLNLKLYQQLDLGKAFLEALKVLLFLAVSLKSKYILLNIYLCLLFLFTGVFLSNFYNSNLSSMVTSKVYEPELEYLQDLQRNNLPILSHTVEMSTLLQAEIPLFIKQRLRSGNNTFFRLKRQSLDMSYMYLARSNLADFYLYQQKFLKIPKAKRLKEGLRYRPLVVTLPHRSPVIQQFNRYLNYIHENGLFWKIIRDTYWHGVQSGNLKLMLDAADQKRSLTMEFFHYVFLIWILGLLCSLISFFIEYFHKKISSYVQKIINKIIK